MGILGHDLRNPAEHDPDDGAGPRRCATTRPSDIRKKPGAGHVERRPHAAHDRAAPRSDARTVGRRHPGDVERRSRRPRAARRQDRRRGARRASGVRDRAARRRRLCRAHRRRSLRAGRLEPPGKRGHPRRRDRTRSTSPSQSRPAGDQSVGAEPGSADRSGVPADAVQSVRARREAAPRRRRASASASTSRNASSTPMAARCPSNRRGRPAPASRSSCPRGADGRPICE